MKESRFYHLRVIKIGLITLALAGCAKPETVKYAPENFINPNRVITEKVNIPATQVNATFGYGNNPAVVKAYQAFTKQGGAKDVRSDSFRTIAYDPYAHPIVSCAPLRLCVIQLEQGEIINDIELGDSKDWLVGKSLVGTAQEGSYQVVLKPKFYDLATDMVITTNKRSYDIGLVSTKGVTSHVVNFYYPEETLSQALQKTELSDWDIQSVVSQSPVIDVSQVNFNYTLGGDKPAWRPTRVFDDGTKTFIEMPTISERMDLPVLYIFRDKQMQLVNYRYRRPYYVVDCLFKDAYLISGKGHEQVRVGIYNHNFN